jgi:hypothetical protein
MFDASVVCFIRYDPSARTTIEALKELKELMGPGGRAGGSAMVQMQQSRSRKGGSDAPRHLKGGNAED